LAVLKSRETARRGAQKPKIAGFQNKPIFKGFYGVRNTPPLTGVYWRAIKALSTYLQRQAPSVGHQPKINALHIQTIPRHLEIINADVI